MKFTVTFSWTINEFDLRNRVLKEIKERKTNIEVQIEGYLRFHSNLIIPKLLYILRCK